MEMPREHVNEILEPTERTGWIDQSEMGLLKKANP
jgi:hypothetical protein